MISLLLLKVRLSSSKLSRGSTTTKAFQKILNNMGIPLYSDQGSEFKNITFQTLLDEHSIKIIFTLCHAAFVESFNKTMKNRMMKCMILKILIIGLKF